MKFGHYDFLARMTMLCVSLACIFGGLAMLDLQSVVVGLSAMAVLVMWCLIVNKNYYERRRKARRAGEQD